MTIQPAASEREPIPVTCFTGFLGASSSPYMFRADIQVL